MRLKWIKHNEKNLGGTGNVIEFTEWFTERARFVLLSEEFSPPLEKPRPKTNLPPHYRGVTAIQPVVSESPPQSSQQQHQCFACGQDHRIYDCPAFKNKSVDDRWEIVKQARVCFNCLGRGHGSNTCRSKRRFCGTSGCRRQHHSLLHGQSPQSTTVNSSPVPINYLVSSSPSLYKYVPVRITGPKGSADVIAFIDDGSKATIIDEKLANDIGVHGYEKEINLQWMNGAIENYKSRQVTLSISSLYNGCSYTISDIFTIPDLQLTGQSIDFEELRREHSELAPIPFIQYGSSAPKLLLGITHAYLTRPMQTIPVGENYAAQEFKLGWTFYGGSDQTSDPLLCHVEHVSDAHIQDLTNVMENYFDLDSLITSKRHSNTPLLTEEDRHAMSILTTTTRRTERGFETGLLWKREITHLPESFGLAISRLHSSERKFKQDPEFKLWYKAKIDDYLQKGYAYKLSPDEVKTTNRTWYLPHFCITNTNKNNKRRLVFDAAAKVKSASLNTHLLKGPPHLQPKPLIGILQHFRQSRIGVCGDIQEMFHRVSIIKQDQDAQRFLWRDGDESKPVEHYAMKAMIFGSRSSPCSAQYVKNINALDFMDTHPRAVEGICDFHYVDDYVDCFDNDEEAIATTKAVIEIHQRAGFVLRGLISNSETVSRQLNKQSVDMDFAKVEATKILGLWWDPITDHFKFRLTFENIDQEICKGRRRPTKAETLSIIMSVFDPFGFLADIMVRAKIIMQKLWDLNLGWSETIPEESFAEFELWKNSLDEARSFTIPRCYNFEFTHPDTNNELHIFTDSSNAAYAAVAYWRISTKDGISVSFIAGKCRSVPRVSPTIPRMELQSAVLGVKLLLMVKDSHTIQPVRTILWSDSKTVISWINNKSQSYDKYITNRLYEILSTTNSTDWKWVPGEDNPADVATRSGPPQLSKWINGPSFLLLPENEWPILSNTNNVIINSVDFSPVEMLIDDTRFSSWTRLRRTAAWVVKAAAIFKALPTLPKGPITRTRAKKTPNPTRTPSLDASELQEGSTLLYRIIQERNYKMEIELLKQSKEVPSSSEIFSLSPVILDDGLIRIGSRIGSCKWIPWACRWPILLPKTDPMTHLLVRHYHQLHHHQNEDTAICAIRKEFWIPAIRQVIRRVAKQCQQCKNRKAKPQRPMMGDLPLDRVQPFVRPFTYTGVDYCGPFMVTIGRRREKRWIALFTCLTIRAVHLEVALNMSSDAFILCLSNFINRRGLPKRLRSDRGTNFVGAISEGTNLFKNECADRGIEWIPNVPGNPEAGGCWERLVQSVKKILDVVMTTSSPSLDVFNSFLIEAESMINSRPLTHLPVTSAEEEPLTPNHFLLGESTHTQTPYVEGKVCLAKLWCLKLAMTNQFWKRWIDEYLPTLTRRTKWNRSAPPIKVGDIVVICDRSLMKGMWPKGRVVEVFEKGGQVRSAGVETYFAGTKALYHRPVSKLAVLDVTPPGTPRMSPK